MNLISNMASRQESQSIAYQSNKENNRLKIRLSRFRSNFHFKFYAFHFDLSSIESLQMRLSDVNFNQYLIYLQNNKVFSNSN